MNKKQILRIIFIFLIFGIIYGLLLSFCLPKGLDILWCVLIQIVSILICLPFSIIFHEAGHMVFGLKSGYQLISFKFLCFEIKQKDEKYVITKIPFNFMILGQCLMAPPKVKKNKKRPFFLYNAGGLVFTYISLFIFIGLYFIPNNYVKWVFSPMIVLVLFLALNNSIYQEEGFNDVSNAIFMKKNPKYIDSVMYQLEMNANLYHGKRFGAKTYYQGYYEDRLNHISLPVVEYHYYASIDHSNLEEANDYYQLLIDNLYHFHIPVQRLCILFDICYGDIVIKRDLNVLKRHFNQIKGPLLKLCEIKQSDVSYYYGLYKAIIERKPFEEYIQLLCDPKEMMKGELLSLEKRMDFLKKSLEEVGYETASFETLSHSE